MASQGTNDDDGSVIVPLEHGQPGTPKTPDDSSSLQVPHGPQAAPDPTESLVITPDGTTPTYDPNIVPTPNNQQPPNPAPQGPSIFAQPEQPTETYEQQASQPPVPSQFIQPSPDAHPESFAPAPAPLAEDGTYVYSDPTQATAVDQMQKQDISRRKLLKIGIVLVVAVIVIFGAITIIGAINGAGYSPYRITNQGTTYSLNFIKNAKVLHANGYTGLEAEDPASSTKVIALAYSSDIDQDCGQAYLSLQVPFKKQVGGQSYSACVTTSSTIYLSDFKYSGKWYEVAVYSSNGVNEVSKSTAKKIIDSIKVD